nr:MAG TPA: hypothetical protein [Caudoviricetes sp.]
MRYLRSVGCFICSIGKHTWNNLHPPYSLK